MLILTQYHHISTSTAFYWLSTTKYQPVPLPTDLVPPSTNLYSCCLGITDSCTVYPGSCLTCSCLCVHVFLFVCLCVCINIGGPLCAEVEGIWSRSTPLHAGHEALLPGLQSTALSFSMPDDQKGCYCQLCSAIAGFNAADHGVLHLLVYYCCYRF